MEEKEELRWVLQLWSELVVVVIWMERTTQQMVSMAIGREDMIGHS
jgi:hypothetical protein